VDARRSELAAALFDVLPLVWRSLRLRMPTELPGGGSATHDQFGVLAELARSSGAGGMSMGELAVARGMSLNGATALVDRLVQAGLVERRPDACDRRVVRVALTPTGAGLERRMRAARRQEMERIIGELADAEVEALVAALPALRRLAGGAPPRAPARASTPASAR